MSCEHEKCKTKFNIAQFIIVLCVHSCIQPGWGSVGQLLTCNVFLPFSSVFIYTKYVQYCERSCACEYIYSNMKHIHFLCFCLAKHNFIYNTHTHAHTRIFSKLNNQGEYQLWIIFVFAVDCLLYYEPHDFAKSFHHDSCVYSCFSFGLTSNNDNNNPKLRHEFWQTRECVVILIVCSIRIVYIV